MNFYALILARKGSKGIKNKNLRYLKKNLTLVKNSVLIAKKSKVFKEIYCSTNSKKIIENLKKTPVKIIKRPNKLAKDNTAADEVVSHFYLYLKKKHIKFPDVVFLLQPTSPFLQSKTIKSIISKYKKIKRANSIISIIKVPHKYHYLNQRSVKKDSKINFIFKNRDKFKQRQQKKEMYCHGNIFTFKTNSFLKSKKILNHPIYSVKLKNFRESIDIDEYQDLLLARKLL